MSAATQRVQKWVWVLIYLGLFLLALGLAVQRSDTAVGWGIAAPGIALIAAGLVLIWVRSRMKNTNE